MKLLANSKNLVNNGEFLFWKVEYFENGQIKSRELKIIELPSSVSITLVSVVYALLQILKMI